MKTINVLASVKKPNSVTGNLGDLFGYMLMEHYCSEYPLSVNRIGVDDDIDNDTFALVGSIIHLCQKKAKQAGEEYRLHVLGCGLIKDDKMPANEKLRYIGVRGPKTKELLPTETEVISDPGLLLSKLHALPKSVKKEEVGFIIHSVDREHFFTIHPAARENLINNYANYEDFLQQLSQYKYVISSSLHGVIFCHAYNIPVCAIRVTDKITGDNFKYQDYYHSIGNTSFESRYQITEESDFKALVESAWQPSEEIILATQNKQEKLIKKSIQEFIEQTSI